VAFSIKLGLVLGLRPERGPEAVDKVAWVGSKQSHHIASLSTSTEGLSTPMDASSRHLASSFMITSLGKHRLIPGRANKMDRKERRRGATRAKACLSCSAAHSRKWALREALLWTWMSE
jgi:hypothetical protein